jgi:succinate-semialdehyde dehydrogenase/glutarate-semialdehyde dehydrogenase
MIGGRQIDVAERHIADAVAKGADVIIGGKRRPGPGRFFEPTVLARCNHTMTVMKQEIFGPIVPFQRVSSDDEAVALANDSHLGLNAYVFTKDKKKADQLALRIEAGSVVVNDVLVNYGMPEAPFGGVKQSGYGRIHGEDALRDMAETKHVLTSRISDSRVDGFFGFPYTAKGYKWQLKMLRALYTSGGVLKRIARLV